MTPANCWRKPNDREARALGEFRGEFRGEGSTTGLVADRLGRDSVLVELLPRYSELAKERIEEDAPLFNRT